VLNMNEDLSEEEKKLYIITVLPHGKVVRMKNGKYCKDCEGKDTCNLPFNCSDEIQRANECV